tara:strand:+ start:166 stop:429 length:264 start_codon:yes stop_codon:yes gene_type:complete
MENKIKSIQEKNRFKEMGFIKFWIFSTLFFLTFPLSIIFCLVFFGLHETKQFVTFLVKDYMQTMFIIFILCLSIITFIIYYVVSLFN